MWEGTGCMFCACVCLVRLGFYGPYLNSSPPVLAAGAARTCRFLVVRRHICIVSSETSPRSNERTIVWCCFRELSLPVACFRKVSPSDLPKNPASQSVGALFTHNEATFLAQKFLFWSAPISARHHVNAADTRRKVSVWPEDTVRKGFCNVAHYTVNKSAVWWQDHNAGLLS